MVGVDTHSRKHVATISNNLGVVIARREFRVTPNDINKFADWSLKVAGVENEKILFAIEGTSSVLTLFGFISSKVIEPSRLWNFLF